MNDIHEAQGSPWIGVDLDGTLAEYHGWKGIHHIGPPIPKMVDRVKRWVQSGKTVKIFTARVSGRSSEAAEARRFIREWLLANFDAQIAQIEVTNEKDFLMLELWDDRAIQIITNTGERSDGSDNEN